MTDVCLCVSAGVQRSAFERVTLFLAGVSHWPTSPVRTAPLRRTVERPRLSGLWPATGSGSPPQGQGLLTPENRLSGTERDAVHPSQRNTLRRHAVQYSCPHLIQSICICPSVERLSKPQDDHIDILPAMVVLVNCQWHLLWTSMGTMVLCSEKGAPWSTCHHVRVVAKASRCLVSP